MFKWLKPDPTKKMKKQYFTMLEQAMLAQRSGDIKTYSMLTSDAEALWKKIELIEQNAK